MLKMSDQQDKGPSIDDKAQHLLDEIIDSNGFSSDFSFLDHSSHAFLIRATTGECNDVVIKIAKDTNSSRYMIETELRMFPQLEGIDGMVHPIPINSPESDRPYYVMPRYERSLHELLMYNEKAEPTLRTMIDYMVRLSQTVIELHRRGIVHKDLTPDNILLDDADLTFIVDFGAAGKIGKSSCLFQSIIPNVGAFPLDMKSDCNLERGCRQFYTPESNVFGLALTLYRMLDRNPTTEKFRSTYGSLEWALTNRTGYNFDGFEQGLEDAKRFARIVDRVTGIEGREQDALSIREQGRYRPVSYLAANEWGSIEEFTDYLLERHGKEPDAYEIIQEFYAFFREIFNDVREVGLRPVTTRDVNARFRRLQAEYCGATEDPDQAVQSPIPGKFNRDYYDNETEITLGDDLKLFEGLLYEISGGKKGVSQSDTQPPKEKDAHYDPNRLAQLKEGYEAYLAPWVNSLLQCASKREFSKPEDLADYKNEIMFKIDMCTGSWIPEAFYVDPALTNRFKIQTELAFDRIMRKRFTTE